MEEEWKDVFGFGSKYRVSNTGKVLSKRRNREFLLKQTEKNGYLYVSLYYDKNKRATLRVHRLVASHFVGGKTIGMEVNHKDCDGLNNCADNLEWCSHQHNINHFYANGKLPSRIKLNNDKAVLIREMRNYSKHFTNKWLAKCFGVTVVTIRDVINRKTWKHI